jgi:hypothetical protein
MSKQKSKKNQIYMVTFLVVLLILVPRKVYAGEVNGNESSVVSTARGSFSVDGKNYHFSESAISQLINYLSRDDVDMTAAQASKASSMIYANLQAGIEGGYLVEDSTGSGSNSDQESSKNEDTKNNEDTEKNSDTKNESQLGDNKEVHTDSNNAKDGGEANSDSAKSNTEGDISDMIDSELVENDSIDNKVTEQAKISVDSDKSVLSVNTRDKTILYTDKLPIKNTGYNMKNTIIALIVFSTLFAGAIYITRKSQYFAKNNES